MVGQRKRQIKSKTKVFGLSNKEDGVVTTKTEQMLDERQEEGGLHRGGGICFGSCKFEMLVTHPSGTSSGDLDILI